MSKTKKILRIVGRVFEALYIVAMLSFSCVAIFSGNKSGTGLSSTPISHTTLLTVKTDSMKGTFDRNALVVAKIPSKSEIMNLKAASYVLVRDVSGDFYSGHEGDQVPATSIRFLERGVDYKVEEAGSIISFPTRIGGEAAINTHRIVEIIGDPNDFENLKFRTKGDNSIGVDANLVEAKKVLAIYKFSIPRVGGWIMNMKEGKTFIFVVIVPLAILFMFNAYIFFKNMSDMKAEKMALEKGAELSDEEKEKLKQEYLKSLMKEEVKDDKEPAPEGGAEKAPVKKAAKKPAAKK